MKRRLNGIYIVVTRAREQASGFAARLEREGARVLVCPTIRIVPPRSWKPLDDAILKIGNYQWLVFTSANGVEMFEERLKKLKVRVPPEIKTCAIGPATAARMKEAEIQVSKTSKEYVAESVLDAMKNVKGQNILIPRAEVARDILPVTLRKRGARVSVVTAYRTKVDASNFSRFKKWLAAGQVRCVTFTSSSTVKNFFSLLNPKLTKNLCSDRRISAASIGPVTSATLRQHRWKPRIVAGKPTTDHLADAICKFYGKEQS